MRNCNDPDFVGCNLIENTVGKPTKDIPAKCATKDRANLGVRQYTTCSSVELGQEREAKVGVRARSIKGGGIAQLVERKGDYDQLHFRAARTLSSASDIGMT